MSYVRSISAYSDKLFLSKMKNNKTESKSEREENRESLLCNAFYRQE